MAVGRQQPESFDSQSRHEGHPIPSDKPESALVRVVQAYFSFELAQVFRYELTELGGEVLSEMRRGENTRHLLVGFLRKSVFGRLAGYEDVNDAERHSHDPVMRAIVDLKGLDRMAASTSQL